MLYRVLADAVVLLHFAAILFILLGGLLVLKWPWAVLVHLPFAIWGVLVEVAGIICPLTPLENRLRVAAGDSGYAGGFVEHYVIPIVYPAGLTRGVQILLGVIVLVVNISVYGWIVWRWQRCRFRRNRPNDQLIIADNDRNDE